MLGFLNDHKKIDKMENQAKSIVSMKDSVVEEDEDEQVNKLEVTTMLDLSIDEEGAETVNQYVLKNVLGKGAFGEVKRARSKTDNIIYVSFFFLKIIIFNPNFKAIKIINLINVKAKMQHNQDQYLGVENEADIQSKLVPINLFYFFYFFLEASKYSKSKRSDK